MRPRRSLEPPTHRLAILHSSDTRSTGAPSRRPRWPRSRSWRIEAFRRLPTNFRALCEDLVIRVDDFPTDEVLDEMEAESEFDLLGLFQGVGLPFRARERAGTVPNMIWLYRRPILDYWAEHDETLGEIVAHVLIHEIGHHFGLSDDDMAAHRGRRRLACAAICPSDGGRDRDKTALPLRIRIHLSNRKELLATMKVEPWTSSPRWKASRRR